MKQKQLMILGICAALVLAVSATATTFASGTKFSHLDWAKFDGQQYGSAAGLPNTGDGSNLGGGPTLRGWLIVGLATGAAVAIGGASLTLIGRRRE